MTEAVMFAMKSSAAKDPAGLSRAPSAREADEPTLPKGSLGALLGSDLTDLIERMRYAARVGERIRAQRADHERRMLLERVRQANAAAEARQAARVRAEVR